MFLISAVYQFNNTLKFKQYNIMQTGINIGEDVRERFQELRMKRQYRYVIYKASADKSSVEVDKCGDRAENFEQFKEAMPKNNSR